MKIVAALLPFAVICICAIALPITFNKHTIEGISVTEKGVFLSLFFLHASNQRQLLIGQQKWDQIVGVWPCVAKVDNSEWFAFGQRRTMGEAVLIVVATNGVVVAELAPTIIGGGAYSIGMTNDPNIWLTKVASNVIIVRTRELKADGKIVIPARTNTVVLPTRSFN